MELASSDGYPYLASADFFEVGNPNSSELGQRLNVPCPACGAVGGFRLATVRNGYRVVGCPRCGCHFVNPRPAEETLSRLYWDYSDVVESLGGEVLEGGEVGVLEAQYHLRHLLDFAAEGRLLDVGCGQGSFLLVAQEYFQVQGTDVAPRPRPEARGIPIFEGRLQDAGYPDASFDVVVALEVLEHLFDPKETLREIHRILRPKGILLLQTGDVGTLLPKLALERWSYLQPPIHLNYLTRSSLSWLLRSSGFRIVESWSFGRAPGRIPLVRRLQDPELLRRLFDIGARFGLIGQAYLALRLDQAASEPSPRPRRGTTEVEVEELEA